MVSRPYDQNDYGGGGRHTSLWMSSGEETKRRDFYTCVAMVRTEEGNYKWSR